MRRDLLTFAAIGLGVVLGLWLWALSERYMVRLGRDAVSRPYPAKRAAGILLAPMRWFPIVQAHVATTGP